MQWSLLPNEEGTQYLNSICEYPNGHFYTVGVSGPYGIGPRLLELSQNGDIIFDSTYSYRLSHYFNDVAASTDSSFYVSGTSGEYSTYSSALIKFCPDSTNYGSLELVSHSPDRCGYKLNHGSGEVEEIIVRNTTPGTMGTVSGDAGLFWSALANGDGNNGDSVIFRAIEPLTQGTIDTFWITLPEPTCSFNYITGCHVDSVGATNASYDLLEFWGGHVGDSLEIRITTQNEEEVDRYEIWAKDWDGQSNFALAQTFQALNTNDVHTYSVTRTYPGYQYLLKVYDNSGCSIEYPDLILTVDVNTPVVQNPAPPKDDNFAVSAYPNPFNSSTTINLDLPHSANERIVLYDLLGRQTALISEGAFPAGRSTVVFDASSLPSGLYFVRLEGNHSPVSHKLLFLK